MWLIFNNQTQFDTWHNQQMIVHPPTDNITQNFTLPTVLEDGRVIASVDDDFTITNETQITFQEKEALYPSPTLEHLL